MSTKKEVDKILSEIRDIITELHMAQGIIEFHNAEERFDNARQMLYNELTDLEEDDELVLYAIEELQKMVMMTENQTLH